MSVSDSVSVILASGCPKIDCKKLLSEIVSPFGGRGGGKPDFAQGGVPDRAVSEKVYSAMIDSVRKCLNG